MRSSVTFRTATPADTLRNLQFIKMLAEYEHLNDEVTATKALLHEWLFEKQKAEVIFAETDGETVGFVLLFYKFSTFLGRAGLCLEDLYVKETYRGMGYGTAILKELARLAVARGCGRLEWQCLDWNRPSIDFYLSLNARSMNDWTVYRLTGNSLLNMAKR